MNGKFYIGKAVTDRPSYLGSGLLLKAAIKKYGKENFTKEIIDRAENNDELNRKEMCWIKTLNSQNKDVGYNLTEGGTGGNTLANHPDRAEIYRKIALSFMGEGNPFYGKHHSKEAIQVNREKHLGNKNASGKRSEEFRQKMCIAMLGNKNASGQTISEEHKQKIRDFHKGKKHSEETKRKMSISHKKRYEEYRRENQL